MLLWLWQKGKNLCSIFGTQFAVKLYILVHFYFRKRGWLLRVFFSSYATKKNNLLFNRSQGLFLSSLLYRFVYSMQKLYEFNCNRKHDSVILYNCLQLLQWQLPESFRWFFKSICKHKVCVWGRGKKTQPNLLQLWKVDYGNLSAVTQIFRNGIYFAHLSTTKIWWH